MSNSKPVREVILSYLEINYEPVHWKIIADKATEEPLNPDTVRSELSRLLYAGRIQRPMRGFYCLKSIGGLSVDLSDLKVHSVQFQWVPSIGFFAVDPLEEFIGDVVLRFGRDLRRRRYSGFLGHGGLGMDLDLFLMSLMAWKLIAARRVGVDPLNDDLKISNVQFNRELVGARLEGCNSLTMTSVLGVLERFYNKPGRVRAEVQAVPKSVREIEAVLRGGVHGYNLQRQTLMMVQELRDIKDFWKHLSPVFLGIVKIQKEILKKLDKE